ncbi:MAG TPA: phasin family protein [Stellaceae bacterium]|jgi:hypothetical protein|nr:phasin family protein [Stellaceae bacterium]
MAKAQAEEMRAKRRDMQIAAAFDPGQALSSMEPLFTASNKWLENCVAVGSELLEFSRSRLDRNLEISKAMAKCGSIDETMGLHEDYARSIVRDYFAQAGKLADLGTRAMFEAFSIWQPALRGEIREEAQPQRDAA